MPPLLCWQSQEQVQQQCSTTCGKHHSIYFEMMAELRCESGQSSDQGSAGSSDQESAGSSGQGSVGALLCTKELANACEYASLTHCFAPDVGCVKNAANETMFATFKCVDKGPACAVCYQSSPCTKMLLQSGQFDEGSANTSATSLVASIETLGGVSENPRVPSTYILLKSLIYVLLYLWPYLVRRQIGLGCSCILF